jgi:hypothetical protein
MARLSHGPNGSDPSKRRSSAPRAGRPRRRSSAPRAGRLRLNIDVRLKGEGLITRAQIAAVLAALAVAVSGAVWAMRPPQRSPGDLPRPAELASIRPGPDPILGSVGPGVGALAGPLGPRGEPGAQRR